MSISIKIQGAAIEDVERLLDRLNNLGAAMDEIGDFAERETKLNFERESSPDGAKWAPLAASTLARKKGGAILRDTSTLVGGIQVVSKSRTSVTVGATAGSEYGQFHQSGTSRFPARKFIGITPLMRTAVPKILVRHIQR